MGLRLDDDDGEATQKVLDQMDALRNQLHRKRKPELYETDTAEKVVRGAFLSTNRQLGGIKDAVIDTVSTLEL